MNLHIRYETPEAQREALYEPAQRDRQMWERLSTWGQRFHSVNDPVEAEVYRERCLLYCALAQGVDDVEQAFQEHYERVKAACERFNAKQEAGLRRGRGGWHNTDIGHYLPDEAWQHLRHAIRMYVRITNAEE